MWNFLKSYRRHSAREVDQVYVARRCWRWPDVVQMNFLQVPHLSPSPGWIIRARFKTLLNTKKPRQATAAVITEHELIDWRGHAPPRPRCCCCCWCGVIERWGWKGVGWRRRTQAEGCLRAEEWREGVTRQIWHVFITWRGVGVQTRKTRNPRVTDGPISRTILIWSHVSIADPKSLK